MWILLALGTAFTQAVKDALIKQTRDVHGLVLCWGYCLVVSALLLIVAACVGFPEIGPGFIAAALVSSIFNSVAFTLYFLALRASDISVTTPLLTLTPLYMLVTSPLILGERPGPWGAAGIALIVCGAYLLNLEERSKGFFAPFKALLRERGSRYMALVALSWSITANFDKIGVRNSDPFFWLATIFGLVALYLSPIVVWRYRSHVSSLRQRWKMTLAIGVVDAASVSLQMFALLLALAPYVIAIKRLSAIFGVMIGAAMFKEKGFSERLWGALVMFAGMVAILLGS